LGIRPTPVGPSTLRGGAPSIQSLDLPFAAFARNEIVVSLIAVCLTAALVAPLAAWLVIVIRPVATARSSTGAARVVRARPASGATPAVQPEAETRLHLNR
jgi:hypothetical protein